MITSSSSTTRLLLFDIPISLITVTFFLTLTIHHLYTHFYSPIMDALTWTPEKRAHSHTSFLRTCDFRDISAYNSQNILIDSMKQTIKKSVEITMTHGAAVIPNLLSPTSILNMREYILEKNANLSDDEAIWLISKSNRWSFLISADDHPSVSPVLREIATHDFFKPYIELLLGDDPAIVELTAITAAYGAGNQHWHSDNDYESCQMHNARDFVSMYSLFIPLQDTTRDMGATSICPGTHLCGEERGLAELCEELDFVIEDSRGVSFSDKNKIPVWKAGDGLLMHLNTYHRGPAHVDPNAKDRVMLILTISSRPTQPYFDSRQISLGTSYSLKWDMHGMTISDLKYCNHYRIKGGVWKFLRTLGIYKWKICDLNDNRENLHRGICMLLKVLDRVWKGCQCQLEQLYSFILRFLCRDHPSIMSSCLQNSHVINDTSWAGLLQIITKFVNNSLHSTVQWLYKFQPKTRNTNILISSLKKIWNFTPYFHTSTIKWGWDYPTVLSSRIVNQQFGFRYHDLDDLVVKFKEKYKCCFCRSILMYLIGHIPRINAVEGTVWRDYLELCIYRLRAVATTAYIISLIFYICITISMGNVTKSLFRMTILTVIFGIPFWYTVQYISITPWGYDILSGKLFEPSFPKIMRDITVHNTLIPKDLQHGPIIFPLNHDVFLPPSSLNSVHFASHSRVFDYHPGNKLWNDLISQYVGIYDQMIKWKYPSSITQRVSHTIVQTIVKYDGYENSSSSQYRFLRQTPAGDWTLVSFKNSIEITTRELFLHSYPFFRSIINEVFLIRSNCQYGRYRHTVMFHWHCTLYLYSLEQFLISKMMESKHVDNTRMKHSRLRPDREDWSYNTQHDKETSNPQKSFMNTFHITSPVTLSHRSNIPIFSTLTKSSEFIPLLGDYVECFFLNDGWFRGKIVDIHEDSTYSINFDDGEHSTHIQLDDIRPFQAFMVGQEVVLRDEYGDTIEGLIVYISGYGTFSIESYDTGEIFNNVALDRIYRIE